MEVAHIVNYEGHEVGNKVLGICGVKWKVTMLWPDIPEDYPICRDCIRVAIRVMNETTEERAEILAGLVKLRRDLRVQLTTLMYPVIGEDSTLTEVLDTTNTYREKREAKAEQKRRLAEARALVAEADAKKDEGDQSGEGDRPSS